MDIKNKIKEIFNESLSTGRDIGSNKTAGVERLNDARRKRNERKAEQRLKKLHKDDTKSIKETGQPKYHPRTFLQKSPLKFSLKESFIFNLIEYLNTGKKKYISEAVSLMEEYPNLKKYVLEQSHSKFPKNPLMVYSIREHFMENVGDIIERDDESVHIWHLSEHEALLKSDQFNNHMILQSQITPDKILIYIPAFTNLMEELIFSGKIEEPEKNIIRLAHQKNEVILPPSVNKSIVTKIQ